VNGHEYGSAEELPEDLRQAYERAMSAGSGPSKVKIVFNGNEYGSVDEMSSDVRRTYEGALAAVKTEFPFHEWKSEEKKPISPAGGWKEEFSLSKKAVGKLSVSSSGARWFILGIGILFGLAALYFLNIK